MFSPYSSDDDDSMSEPLSTLSSPSGLLPTNNVWNNLNQTNGNEGQLDGSIVQGIELSPVYPNGDSLAEEISSQNVTEQEFLGNNETPISSRQSTFSQANNENIALQQNQCSTIVFEPMEKYEEKPSFEMQTQTRLKIRVKCLKMVSEWRWLHGKGDNCGICRTSFETCCVDCKFPGDDCPLVLGACNHPFHMHCIVKWTNAQNGQKPACPLCRQEWKFAS